MAVIHLKLDGDGCWPELADKRDQWIVCKDVLHMAVLPAGTNGGRPSVTFRIDLPDGRVVLTETTLRLLLTTVDAIRARYGDPNREG